MRTTKYPGLRQFLTKRLKQQMLEYLGSLQCGDERQDKAVKDVKKTNDLQTILRKHYGTFMDEDPITMMSFIVACFIPDFETPELMGMKRYTPHEGESVFTEWQTIAHSLHRVVTEQMKCEKQPWRDAVEVFQFGDDGTDELVNEVYNGV